MKGFIKFFIFIAIVGGIIGFYNYKTNYNWRYRQLLKDITDVPGNEYITKVEMTVFKKPISTCFDVTVVNKEMTLKETYQMAVDIAEKMNELLPNEENQTLPFANNVVELYIEVLDSKSIYVAPNIVNRVTAKMFYIEEEDRAMENWYFQ